MVKAINILDFKAPYYWVEKVFEGQYDYGKWFGNRAGGDYSKFYTSLLSRLYKLEIMTIGELLSDCSDGTVTEIPQDQSEAGHCLDSIKRMLSIKLTQDNLKEFVTLFEQFLTCYYSSLYDPIYAVQIVEYIKFKKGAPIVSNIKQRESYLFADMENLRKAYKKLSQAQNQI